MNCTGLKIANIMTVHFTCCLYSCDIFLLHCMLLHYIMIHVFAAIFHSNDLRNWIISKINQYRQILLLHGIDTRWIVPVLLLLS